MSDTPEPLPSTSLHRITDPAALGFAVTDDLEPTDEVFGQHDAMEALAFGLSIPSPGHNVFVLGAPGSGRLTYIRKALAEQTRDGATPSDWCYVFNFDDPRRPRVLEMPAGRARRPAPTRC